MNDFIKELIKSYTTEEKEKFEHIDLIFNTKNYQFIEDFMFENKITGVYKTILLQNIIMESLKNYKNKDNLAKNDNSNNDFDFDDNSDDDEWDFGDKIKEEPKIEKLFDLIDKKVEIKKPISKMRLKFLEMLENKYIEIQKTEIFKKDKLYYQDKNSRLKNRIINSKNLNKLLQIEKSIKNFEYRKYSK